MGNFEKMKMAVNPVYPYAWDNSKSVFEMIGTMVKYINDLDNRVRELETQLEVINNEK